MDTKALWQDFLTRISSRKFLLTTLGVGLVLGNHFFKWNLSQENLNTVVAFVGLFVGMEGTSDIIKGINEGKMLDQYVPTLPPQNVSVTPSSTDPVAVPVIPAN